MLFMSSVLMGMQLQWYLGEASSTRMGFTAAGPTTLALLLLLLPAVWLALLISFESFARSFSFDLIFVSTAPLKSFTHSPRASTKTGEHWPFYLVRDFEKRDSKTTHTH